MSGRKGNTIKELDSIKGKALKMTKKIKEKRLILVFGFSVDVSESTSFWFLCSPGFLWVQGVILWVYFLVLSMGLFGFFKLSLSCFSGHVGRVVSDFSFGESSGYLFLGGGGGTIG